MLNNHISMLGSPMDNILSGITLNINSMAEKHSKLIMEQASFQHKHSTGKSKLCWRLGDFIETFNPIPRAKLLTIMKKLVATSMSAMVALAPTCKMHIKDR